jgi:hypothetical protein
MPNRRLASIVAVLVSTELGCASVASAQAWVPPARTGAVTVSFQTIDHHGHLLDDGTLLADGKSVTAGLATDGDYAVTDRLAISAGVPFVMAKYRGPGPPPPFVPFLPRDMCHCWHGGVQDLTAGVRYQLPAGGGAAVTPNISVVLPTHAYDYQGEAVIGRRLRELHVGASAAVPLAAISPRLSIETTYAYAFVERVLDVPNNRSNGSVDATFAMSRRWSVHSLFMYQRTHGGLRMPSDIAAFPDRILEHDRLLRDDSLRLGGGIAYGARAMDFFATYVGYSHGTNTHAERALVIGVSRPFDISRRSQP